MSVYHVDFTKEFLIERPPARSIFIKQEARTKVNWVVQQRHMIIRSSKGVGRSIYRGLIAGKRLPRLDSGVNWTHSPRIKLLGSQLGNWFQLHKGAHRDNLGSLHKGINLQIPASTLAAKKSLLFGFLKTAPIITNKSIVYHQKHYIIIQIFV